MRKHLTLVALSLPFGASLAAQTVWTGAVSTNWFTAGNWSAGVPTAATAVRIALTPTQPSMAGFADCASLVVDPGTALTLTSAGNLTVHGNASFAASVLGTGTIYFDQPAGGPSTVFQVAFTNQASVPNLVVGDGLDATLQTPNVRGQLRSQADFQNGGGTITLHGAVVLGTASFSGTPQGNVNFDPTGSLDCPGSFSLEWTMQAPGTMAVGTFFLNPTSTITPTTGVIRIPPGRQLNLDTSANSAVSMSVEVPATSSFRLVDNGQGASGHDITLADSSGSTTIDSAVDATIRFASLTGSLVLRGPSLTLQTTAASGPVIVSSGATMTLPDNFPDTIATVRGSLQIDGTLRIDASSTLRLDDLGATRGRLAVGTNGALRLVGNQFGRARVEGNGTHTGTVELGGLVECATYDFVGLGPAGVRLLAGSTIGAAPNDLRNGLFDDGAPVAGSVLLQMERTAATRLDGIAFESTNTTAAFAVRATTPFAVDVRNASGSLGDESHESDPLAVISWTDGISFHGTATPGCLGLAETRTVGEPHIGTGYTIRCTNAHPGGAGLQLIGITPVASPLPLFGVDLWIDPSRPLVSPLVIADAAGRMSLPQQVPNNPHLVGRSFWSQCLILEPVACRASELSGSTAIRITVLP